mgnify:CR=1 FL=1
MGIKTDWYLLDDDEKAIISLKERIESLVTIATRTTRGFEATGSRKIGGTKDKNADIVLKIMELESELASIDYEHHLSRCALIVNIANTVPKEKRKVFVDRYLRNMSLNETAKANGITKMTTCRILKNFEKKT